MIQQVNRRELSIRSLHHLLLVSLLRARPVIKRGLRVQLLQLEHVLRSVDLGERVAAHVGREGLGARCLRQREGMALI